MIRSLIFPILNRTDSKWGSGLHWFNKECYFLLARYFRCFSLHWVGKRRRMRCGRESSAGSSKTSTTNKNSTANAISSNYKFSKQSKPKSKNQNSATSSTPTSNIWSNNSQKPMDPSKFNDISISWPHLSIETITILPLQIQRCLWRLWLIGFFLSWIRLTKNGRNLNRNWWWLRLMGLERHLI